ncbi:MAG TPA: cupin domain-containing protein [Roseiarcus sp.]|nr:cupin domain-containing protein [Roseiarcus sp.]
MLTRRGFATCALCAITGFAATAAEAQSAAASGFKRTILQRVDGPSPGYETVMVAVEIEPGVPVAKHTHPGVESSFVIEGETELSVEGQAPRTIAAGESFQIPAGVPHSGKNGAKPTRIAAVYVVEKGKPLASPA